MTTDLSDREKQILNLLIEQGTVTVVELSKQLAVSEVTIRSDLRNLEERGLLNRIHGGAVPSIHPNIIERQNLLVETKQRIAKNKYTMKNMTKMTAIQYIASNNLSEIPSILLRPSKPSLILSPDIKSPQLCFRCFFFTINGFFYIAFFIVCILHLLLHGNKRF